MRNSYAKSEIMTPLFLMLSIFLTQACGTKGGGSGSSNATNENKLIQIPISMTSTDQSSSLTLAAPGSVAATSFVVSLESCSSGLTGTNGSPGVLNVYIGDTNCLGKLTSFVLNSLTYVPTGGGSVPFTTWLAGNTAVFVSGSNLVYLQVVSQLNSPIVNTDVISYNFTFIKSGTNNASITVSEAHTLYTAGTKAPNFTIGSGDATLSTINGSGVGVFSFKLTCTTGAMTVGANVSYNSFCPDVTAGGTIAGGATGVDIGVAAQFNYKLIADPNNNGTLTLAQAQSAMASGTTNVTLGGGVILAGSTGFQSALIDGPGAISSYPKLILVLQARNTVSGFTTPAYSSFQYFAITLPTVTP